MNPDTERSLQNEIKTYENGLTKIKNNKGKVFKQAYKFGQSHHKIFFKVM